MRKRLLYWWMKLGDGMHAVNSFVLLTLFYWLLLTPLALLLRLLGRDPLKKERDDRSPSYWERPEDTESGSLSRQF